jgi:hypothetical protein
MLLRLSKATWTIVIIFSTAVASVSKVRLLYMKWSFAICSSQTFIPFFIPSRRELLTGATGFRVGHLAPQICLSSSCSPEREQPERTAPRENRCWQVGNGRRKSRKEGQSGQNHADSRALPEFPAALGIRLVMISSRCRGMEPEGLQLLAMFCDGTEETRD